MYYLISFIFTYLKMQVFSVIYISYKTSIFDDLYSQFCYSVNVDKVVVLFGGGGDMSTLHAVIELVLTFCTPE